MIKNNTKSKKSLNVQKKIGLFDFPFTLSPYIGCEMQCSYCFSPKILWMDRDVFFQNVDVRINFPALVQKDLKKYSSLPQHLKRVQMGETTELFQPKVINYMKNNMAFDLNEEILKVFKNEWNNGNKWMLHILTKNHNILSYLPLLKTMKEMIQVELSFVHIDEKISRQYEKFTSTIQRRMDAIEQLSNEGIFVRVMAMPFFGNKNDVLNLQNSAFLKGAQAIKNKSLNYYEWNKIKNINPLDPLKQTKSKNNFYLTDLIIKSGEEIVPSSTKPVLVPKVRKRGEEFINWSIKPNGLELRDVPLVDMGYSVINNVDWGYLK